MKFQPLAPRKIDVWLGGAQETRFSETHGHGTVCAPHQLLFILSKVGHWAFTRRVRGCSRTVMVVGGVPRSDFEN